MASASQRAKRQNVPLAWLPSARRSLHSSRKAARIRHDRGVRLRVATSSLFAAATLPMEPRQVGLHRRPWFEGWFFRLVDHGTGASAAIIFGSLRRRGKVESTTPFDEHLLVLAYRDGHGRDVSESALLKGDSVALEGGSRAVGPRVSWWSDQHGGMSVKAGGSVLDVRFASGTRLTANSTRCTRTRVRTVPSRMASTLLVADSRVSPLQSATSVSHGT